MSRHEIELTMSPPSWPERAWYRRLGEAIPHATASSGPWHADWVCLLPYRWRWLHRLYAGLFGFFWIPCPLCDRPYGGHELGTDIPDPTRPPPGGMAICSRCTIERNREAMGG